MLLVMKDVLSVDDCNKVIDRMNAQRFEAGTKTAGWHAKLVKNNEQLDRTHPDYAPLRSRLINFLEVGAHERIPYVASPPPRTSTAAVL